MKRKFKPKETWDSFEKRVGVKRTGTTAKKVGMNVPNDLFIYLASPQGQGHHNSVSQLLWARIT